MTPYAELLEITQPNPIRKEGFTRIRDQFEGLRSEIRLRGEPYQHFNNIMYDPERIIEFAGSWDYGEKNALKTGTREDSIIARWIKSGEQSMIEMGTATFFLECSRVVSHEIVRHRLASYQQESQRFVSYKNGEPTELCFVPDDLDDEDAPILYEDYDGDIPLFKGVEVGDAYRGFVKDALALYNDLIDAKVPKQIARYVLPNAMRTRIIMSTNVREWRHIIQLRLDRSAQPEMQQLMQQVYDQLVDVFPQSLAGVLDSGRGIR